MVKVSVIVPVYNVENFLDKCLDSLINQTLSDIEIICIDDGSTDSSLEILKQYAKKDNRMILVSQQNSGPNKTRNKGINLAKGEYLTFVDSDDWLELNCLEKIYLNAISNNSEVVLFNAMEYRPNNKFHKRIYLPVDKNIDYNNFIFDYEYNKELVMNNFFVVWSKLYKTSFLKENNIIFQNFSYFEDVPFHIESILFANRISYFPEVLYNYNKLNADSQQNQKMKINHRLAIFDIFNYVENLLVNKNYYEEFKLKFIEFKLLQSHENLSRTEFKFKEEYYTRMRNEFFKMDLNSKILQEMPFNLYKFYIKTINFKSFHQFNVFNQNITVPWDFIDKKDLSHKIANFNEMGITLKDTPQEIIVSLTSIPERMYDIHYCLYSLLNQSLKPNKLILWLAEDQFPNKEKDLPETVLNLKKNGLEIKWSKNIKSYKKLIPALKEYPNSYIVTADDDIYYPNDWLKNLWEAHEKFPNSIIASRSRRMILDEGETIFKNYIEWDVSVGERKASYFNFPTNGAGTLFYPNALSDEVLDEELFLRLCPSGDDVWFWAMAVLNKTKIYSIENSLDALCYVNISRELNLLDEMTLWDVNQTGQNDIQLNNVLNRFPEILDMI